MNLQAAARAEVAGGSAPQPVQVGTVAPVASAPVERTRLQLDLSPAVAALLDHVSTVTGVQKSQLVMRCLLDQLPALLDLADSLKRRVG